MFDVVEGARNAVDDDVVTGDWNPSGVTEHDSDSWTSLVTLTKCLVCGRRGSWAVKAYRKEEGAGAPAGGCSFRPGLL
jgi:hypothetical protein